mmetsp:Transcript_39980/g.96507  ORF Transcript_39980/g.96507 Transcript_39980/m.96507 type:complete len:417 (-) Transcript_39980:43-1293(-)
MIIAATMAAASSITAAAAAGTKILDLLIIGGGLSGAMVAHDYQNRHAASASASESAPQAPPKSWNLLEARSVLGGRLVNDSKDRNIDLGGAWIWPSQQPNIRRLISELDDDIVVFTQPDDDSSTRIDGGAVQLVHSLSKNLPKDRIFLNTPVTKYSLVAMPKDDNSQVCNGEDAETDASERVENVVRVETTTPTNNSTDEEKNPSSSPSSVFYARQVVIAVPPRIVFEHMQFDPPLSPEKQQAMESSHTWMAGVTKISLEYSTKFWTNDVSNMGLPSHLGPAFQVYDASTKDGNTSALTFFALTKTDEERQLDDKALGEKVAKQIASVWKYFGHSDMANQAMYFSDVHIQRWPLEPYISENPRPTTVQPHPHPIGALSRNEWNGMLLFAGSEADQRSSGVMEGAIGSAKRVLKDIV